MKNGYNIWVACLFFLINSLAFSDDIYVDQSYTQASDDNIGTEELPLLTIDHALEIVQPGDHVIIKGSEDENAVEAVYDRSGKDGLPICTPGTDDNEIVIEAYSGHTVILRGDGTEWGVDLDNASYHEIRGITFQNFNQAADGFSEDKHDILIEDCEFTETYQTGLRLRYITNLTMRDVYVHHCYETGISVRYCSNVLLERVESSYNSDGMGSSGDGDGISSKFTEDFVCIDCRTVGNSEDGFEMTCNGVLINCVSLNHTACNMKVWRREEDGYSPKRIDAVNCIFSGATQTGIKVSQGAQLNLYNSVVCNNGEEGVAFRDPTDFITTTVESQIVNSIIVENGTYGIRVEGTNLNVVDADHNLYFQNGSGNIGLFSDVDMVTGQDPLFFAPSSAIYQIQESSPALDAGRYVEEVEALFSTYLSLEYAQDIDGDQRAIEGAWDIGVDERIVVTNNSAPTFTATPTLSPIDEGQTLTLQFEANDPENDSLVYFLVGGDIVDGMAIDVDTGVFTFTPDYDQGGDNTTLQQQYDITIGGTDEYFTTPAGETNISIQVNNVNRSPIYNGLDLYTLVAGRSWMLHLPASDSDGDTLTYSVTGSPDKLQFDSSTGVIFWEPSSSQVGQHEIVYVVSDEQVEMTKTITLEVLSESPYGAPTSEADIFYVDQQNGNDASTGQTEESAWESISKAASMLTAGQMVLIRSGTYYESIRPGSGELGLPIIYKAYPDETPVLNGINSGSSPEAFRGGEHLVFDGLTFCNYDETIHCGWEEGDVIIANCTIEDATNYGIYAFSGDRLRIENVTFRNIGSRAISVNGTNIHLNNIIIENAEERGFSANADENDNITMMNADISQCGRYGVYINGKNTFIKDVQIYQNTHHGITLLSDWNFCVNMTVSDTQILGSSAINLQVGEDSIVYLMNSCIEDSELDGVYLGSDSSLYLKSSVIENNTSENINNSSDAAVVEIENSSPIFYALSDENITTGTLLTLTIKATDPDGDTLTFSAANLPSGAAFNIETQEFVWTPSTQQAGTYQITFSVSDGQASDSETMNITVSAASVVITDVIAPDVSNTNPEAEAIQVPLNTLISLILSDSGDGIDPASVVIRVDGDVVYTGDTGFYTSDTGKCRRSGTASSYSYYYQADEEFNYSQQVTVSVDAADLNSNSITNESFSFTMEMRSFGDNVAAISAGTYEKGAVSTAVDSSGNKWMAWHEGTDGARDIYVGMVDDTSGGIANPVQVTSDFLDQCYPQIMINTSDRICLVWQSYSSGGAWDVVFGTSLDGINWTTRSVVESNYNQTQPAMACDTTGTVYVAFEDDRNGNQDVYLAYSSDLFASSTLTSITSDSADQTKPVTEVDSSNCVYIAWQDERNGNGDIYGATSADSWANRALITDSGDQTDPALAVDKLTNTAHLLWVDSSSGNEDVCYASSMGFTDGPLTVTRFMDDTTEADQNEPAIATYSTDSRMYVYACWKDSRSIADSTDTDLYFADLGTDSSHTNILVGDDSTNSDQSRPFVGVDEIGSPYIVWCDDREGVDTIYYTGDTHNTLIKSTLIAADTGGTVGTSPASIDDLNDVSIQVPASACTADVNMTISEIKNPPALDLPMIAAYDFGPSNIEFEEAVTVTIPYAVSESSSSAYPYWYNSLTTSLSQQGITDIERIVVSDTIHALTFKTTHFTPFYLVNVDSSVSSTTSGGGGGCALTSNGAQSPASFFLPLLGIGMVWYGVRSCDRGRRRNHQA